MGNCLYRAIGKRAITICLHDGWSPFSGYDGRLVYAADGVIDALMRSLPPELRRVGFDTHGTPFGELTGKTAVYSQGYEHFTLADFCDGYIIQKPLSEYATVTVIPNFINAANLERARLYRAFFRLKPVDAETFMRTIRASTDMVRQNHAHLQ
jgi:hypothetical protein